MRSKLLSKGDGIRTFVVVLDSGEEAFRSISDFAARQNVTAAGVTAIGAFESATVGWFDFASKTYRRIPVAAQCEVLSAIGDIAAGDKGEPACTCTRCSASRTDPPAAATCWRPLSARRSR